MPPSGRPEAARRSAAAGDGAAPLEVLARGGTVVTATRRLARHLRLCHDRAQQGAGRGAWPSARVFSWEAWIARTWEAAALSDERGDGPGDSQPGAGRFRSLLTEDETRLLWRRVIDDSGDLPPLDGPVLADLAGSAWALCRAWGIPIGDLHRAADSADTAVFAGWAAELERRCQVMGRIDPASAAVLLGRGDAPVRVLRAGHCFAGFDPWTPVAEGLAGRILRSGGQTGQAARPEVTGDVVRVTAPDAAAEIRMAAEWARAALDRDPSTRIGLVVQDLDRDGDSIRRICQDVLAPGWQFRAPAARVVSLSGGRRLADYPVVHAALLLLRAATGTLEWLTASALLRSPFFGDAVARAGRAQVELALRDRTFNTLPVQALAADCRVHAPGMAAALDSCGRHATSRRLPTTRWAEIFTALLQTAGWPGTRPADSEAFQVQGAWQRLLESFAACGSLAGAMTVAEAVRLVADLAHHRRFEPEGREDGLQVLGPLEADGLAFDRLWISGLVADALPAAVRPNPLVPLELQRRHGVPHASAALSLDLASRRFTRLLASAGSVVCSWPVRSGEEEAVMSPLLAGLADADEPAFRRTSAGRDREAVRVAVTVEQAADDVPPPWPGGGVVRGGTRLLSRHALCPALAFCEGRLGVRELQAPAVPLSARMRGQIAHRLLEKLYRQDDCRRGLAHPPEERLRAAFDAVVGPVLGEFLPAGDACLDRLQTLERGRLWRLCLALRTVDGDRAEFTVLTEDPCEVQAGPLHLRVRPDRIDERCDGSRLVIDYKTGSFTSKGWKSPRLTECQLPLYAGLPGVRGIAVLPLGRPVIRAIGVAADGLDVAGLLAPEKFLRESGVQWPALVDRWRDQLRVLAAEFAAGDFRIDPGQALSVHGQFALLTRIHELGLWSNGEGTGGDGADGELATGTGGEEP